MKAVTGSKCDAIEVAEKVLRTVEEHTSSTITARAALQIAEISITSRDLQSHSERSLSAEVPEQSSVAS
jgi:hypothetical protein